MADRPENESRKGVLGKKMIIGIAVLLIAAALVIVYYNQPSIYFYEIKDGNLALYRGRTRWLDTVRIKALEPIPVEKGKVEALTRTSYKSLDAALADYAKFIPAWIQEQEESVRALEPQLERAYRNLLSGLRSARSAGVPEYDEQIRELERRMAIYHDSVRMH